MKKNISFKFQFYIICIAGYMLVLPVSEASQVAGWWGGSWKCTIDGRSARMKWTVVEDNSTTCRGESCSTSHGVRWKGLFSDNGSKWVLLKNPSIESRGGIYFLHADGNRWYLAKPENNKTQGWTTWNERRYPLICERQMQQGAAVLNATPRSTTEIRITKPFSSVQNAAKINNFSPRITLSFNKLPPFIPAKGSIITRGFDENGEPYVEQTSDNGVIYHRQQEGVTLIWPDGRQEYFPSQRFLSNAQAPTPPRLPADPKLGRDWLSNHNEHLLKFISRLVNDDTAEMQKFSVAETAKVGDDLFKQIEYRVHVLETLVQP